jgi:hypothetical protein
MLLEKHSALQVRAVCSTKCENVRSFFFSFYAAILAVPDPAAELDSPKK